MLIDQNPIKGGIVRHLASQIIMKISFKYLLRFCFLSRLMPHFQSQYDLINTSFPKSQAVTGSTCAGIGLKLGASVQLSTESKNQQPYTS